MPSKPLIERSEMSLNSEVIPEKGSREIAYFFSFQSAFPWTFKLAEVRILSHWKNNYHVIPTGGPRRLRAGVEGSVGNFPIQVETSYPSQKVGAT
jgi:hypothetical protein